MPSEPFDARAYWTRLHEQPDLRAVGQSGLPVELNAALYAIARRNVEAFLRRAGALSPAPKRVFDAGAGTGFWSAFWLDHGAQSVDGCDLVPAAVDRLNAEFPGRYLAGDLADGDVVPADASYDLVEAMNVLLHILDDRRFERALANLAGALRPGGRLLLAEPVLTATPEPVPRAGASSRARALDRYLAVLAPLGLELVAIGPSTIVAANPIEDGHPRFRWYRTSWRRAAQWARRGPRQAAAVGHVLGAVDRILMRLERGPSGKLLLFEKTRP